MPDHDPMITGGPVDLLFPGQSTEVTSSTFQTGKAATAQIFSSTRVMDSTADTGGLAAPFEPPDFATCYGQLQAAAAAPVTVRVQMGTLSAPPGVEAYAYSATFTLSNRGTSVVEDASIIGRRTATVLQASSPGATSPPDDVASAYGAVVGRMAKAAG